MFTLTEAKALIIRHRDAVLAFARALMIHKALNAVIIHEIVASAPERTRRDDCAVVEQDAAFAVHELEAVERACCTGIPQFLSQPPSRQSIYAVLTSRVA
jgi:hypothetical protein